MQVYAMAVATNDAAALLEGLCEILRCDLPALRAVVAGEVEVDCLAVRHPGGGWMGLEKLADYQALVAEVEAAGGPTKWYRATHLQREPAERKERQATVALKPCSVYWLKDEVGRVLYVGISRNVDARIKQHEKQWGPVFTQVDTRQLPCAEEALALEASEIARLLPPLNSAGI